MPFSSGPLPLIKTNGGEEGAGGKKASPPSMGGRVLPFLCVLRLPCVVGGGRRGAIEAPKRLSHP